jgi:16S rRNA (cytosine967-C5)-methyltransferase
LNEFILTQREILSTAAELVADGGKLVYATCSVLACENTAQVAWFLDQNNRWTVQNQTQWYPNDNGDGFFASVLTQL